MVVMFGIVGPVILYLHKQREGILYLEIKILICA